jgi:hypothetical protein
VRTTVTIVIISLLVGASLVAGFIIGRRLGNPIDAITISGLERDIQQHRLDSERARGYIESDRRATETAIGHLEGGARGIESSLRIAGSQGDIVVRLRRVSESLRSIGKELRAAFEVLQVRLDSYEREFGSPVNLAPGIVE